MNDWTRTVLAQGKWKTPPKQNDHNAWRPLYCLYRIRNKLCNRNIKWTLLWVVFKGKMLRSRLILLLIWMWSIFNEKHKCGVTLRNPRAQGHLGQHRGSHMCFMCFKGTFTWVMWNGLPQKSWSAPALHCHSLSGWQQGIACFITEQHLYS